ncbi:hypothetical protein AWJ20_3014 [Sugiyamaella lignohabitans]|uniref:Dihydrodipicolinate synthase n=1 Tax=Sugiyamaella lignohabitans TaxID=796027 RepID=A0A161HMZ3_9ASCO|nr:uncharacterized protein AWJ20_3014 [Sugiyamaella lignohabitans]ANB15387.1 hypothetical protein AWJ20_3014 [Sugiyamaella lignohabitans]
MTASAPAPGVYTPVPTFFKSGSKGKYELDIDTQVKHAAFLAENGIKGVVLLGSTGEMIHLTREERIELIAGVKKGLTELGHTKFEIYAGVAHNGIQDTIDEIEAVKKAGATYAMALAPNYFAPASTQASIIEWFTEVANASALPIVIYYFPGVSNGLLITPDTLAELSAHPNIVGVKLSHGDLSHYAQLALNPKVQANDFTTFTGLGQVLLPAISVGISATIDAISSAYPKSVVKLFNLALEGKTKEAQKIQYLVSRAEEIIVAKGPVGTKYAVAKALGYSKQAQLGRPPLSEPLTTAQIERFEPELEALAALEKSL